MRNPTGSAILLAVLVSIAPARAQNASASGERPWLDATLLAAAKGEGSLIVYSSTNEQEGLPLFKRFTDATGIAVAYVRASDAVLMSRMGIEPSSRRMGTLMITARSGKLSRSATMSETSANGSACSNCARAMRKSGVSHSSGRSSGDASRLATRAV